MGFRQFVLVGLLVLVPPSAMSSMHALLKQPWYLLESQNFSLMTNTKEADAHAMLRDLEQFRRVVMLVTGIREASEPSKVRAVVFAKASQFRRIAYRREIAGYMRPSLRGSRLVTSSDVFGSSQRDVLFHEYVHHLVRISADTNYPAWYDEGLADMLATTHVLDGRIIVGAPAKTRLRVLHNNPYQVGLGRVLSVQDMNEVHGFQVGYFLGVSWGLTNYLHFGHLDGGVDRMHMLDRYFELSDDNQPQDKAFEQAFGITVRGMEKELKTYLKKKRQPVLSLAQDRYRYRGNIERVEMSQSEAVLELISQALLGNPQIARRLADHGLATDPDNPRLLSAKGLAWQAIAEFEKAEALVRLAHQRDTRDPVLAINYAEVLLNWNTSECEPRQAMEHSSPDGVCALRLETARKVYVEALRRTPQDPELRNAYGTLLLTQFSEYDHAIEHLRYALNFQHWNSSLHLRIGLAHHGNGNEDEAVEQLRKALYWAESSRNRQDASHALTELAGRSDSQR